MRKQRFCLSKCFVAALLLLGSFGTNGLETTNGKALGSLSPTPGVKQGYKMFQGLEITQQCTFIFDFRLLLEI